MMKMKRVILFLILSFEIIGQAEGMDRYMSPNGSNSNPGTQALPWLTFTYSLPLLYPGDTLFLMDGTYESGTTGLPSLNCRTNTRNGTSHNRITLKSLNERKAFLKSDNSARSFSMNSCSYWNVEGVRFEGGDFPAWGNAIFTVSQSHDLVFKRILGCKSNRLGYYQLFEIDNSYNILNEENELYDFTVHGIMSFMSSNITNRRNYVNSRGYPDKYNTSANGGAGISYYNSRDSISENNIVENALKGLATTGGDTANIFANNNQYLGNIANNVNYEAFYANGRWATAMIGTIMKDNIAINDVPGYANTAIGFELTNQYNATVENSTVIFNVPSTHNFGFYIDRSTGTPGTIYESPSGPLSTNVTNALVILNVGDGFLASGLTNWKFEYTNVYGGAKAWEPEDGHVTFSSQINPQLGTCKVWIPSSSPMKGGGKNGADIGANVLYRYQDGVLTNTPLWNTTTGAFPHGSIIAGVNDIAGESAFDVHTRLNINTNGCAFPAGYSSYIHGTVLNNSIGIAGVTVATNTSINTSTDASGSYLLPVPPGTYKLTATSEPIFYPNSSVTVIVAAGTSVVQDIELVKRPTGNISGVVTVK